MSELVVGTDDKGVEGVPRIHSDHVGPSARSSGPWRGKLRMSNQEGGGSFGLSPTRRNKLDLPRTAEHFRSRFLNQSQIIALDKELMDAIGNSENKFEPVIGNDIHALKPAFVSVRADSARITSETDVHIFPQSNVIESYTRDFCPSRQTGGGVCPRQERPQSRRNAFSP